MVNMHLVDPDRSRIVLIGTARHAIQNSLLPDVPEVSANVTDLAELFMDRGLSGFSPDRCALVPEGAEMRQIGEILQDAADSAEDLLLIYYAGHGLLDRRGELYLALAETHPGRLAFSALRYDNLRNICLDSSAKNRVVILDSCFSGRAIGPALAPVEQEVMGQLEVEGSYTLTSAPANRTARILQGERNTAFTGRLLGLLREGSEEAGPALTLGDIYRHLHVRLKAEGLPTPQQRGSATADLIGLVRNRRYATMPEGVLPKEIRANLESPLPNTRVRAVRDLATWLTNPDPIMAHAALMALNHVAEQDNPYVASIARAALHGRLAVDEQAATSAATSAFLLDVSGSRLDKAATREEPVALVDLNAEKAHSNAAKITAPLTGGPFAQPSGELRQAAVWGNLTNRVRPITAKEDVSRDEAYELSPEERLVLVALAKRFLERQGPPSPLTWVETADLVNASRYAIRRWSPKTVANTVQDVRERLHNLGVRGMVRDEVGEPIGPILSHNLIRELLRTKTLSANDLELLAA